MPAFRETMLRVLSGSLCPIVMREKARSNPAAVYMLLDPAEIGAAKARDAFLPPTPGSLPMF